MAWLGGRISDWLDRLRDRRFGKETGDDVDQAERDFEGCIETGFQLATFQGPLCAEPMEGLAFFVESLEIDRAGIQAEQGEHSLWPI